MDLTIIIALLTGVLCTIITQIISNINVKRRVSKETSSLYRDIFLSKKKSTNLYNPFTKESKKQERYKMLLLAADIASSFVPIVGDFYRTSLSMAILLLMEREKKSRDSSKKIYIVKEIANKKMHNNSLAYFYLIISLLSYFVFSLFFSLSIIIEIVITIFILLVFTNQKILEYRISKGLYGTNESEAREILQFIIENQNKYSDGKGVNVFSSQADYDEQMSSNKVTDGEDLQYE